MVLMGTPSMSGGSDGAIGEAQVSPAMILPLRTEVNLDGDWAGQYVPTRSKYRRGLSTNMVVICCSVTPRSRSAGSTSRTMCS